MLVRCYCLYLIYYNILKCVIRHIIYDILCKYFIKILEFYKEEKINCILKLMVTNGNK